MRFIIESVINNRTIKETSFVYQGKRRFFLRIRAKYGQNHIKSGKTGFETVFTAVPEPIFSFPTPKTRQKCWCTFCGF